MSVLFNPKKNDLIFYSSSSSTRNTRIERLWVEVGSQFARRWRAFFQRLERLHRLDHTNAHHLWLLHLLFLPLINVDCRKFQAEWNTHPVSGRGASDQTPLVRTPFLRRVVLSHTVLISHINLFKDMRLLGMVQHGVYTDDCDGLTPDEINEIYGVDGMEQHRHPGQTGAGHPPDEDSEDEDSAEEDWVEEPDSEDEEGAAELADNIAHHAVRVRGTQCPFATEQHRQAFISALVHENDAETIHRGYGVHPDEWEDGDYPSFELLQVGRKASGELQISLPIEIWQRRAEMWARALHLMITAQEMFD